MSETLEPLIQALERRDNLSPVERDRIRNMQVRVREFSANEEIIPENSRPTASCLMLEGFSARAKFVSSGGRTLSAVHIPGDFVDLHGFLLKPMDHSVMSLSSCSVAFVPHQELHAITNEFSHLARLLWLSTLIDAAIHRAWMTAMGRLSSAQQLGHFFCEILLRLKAVNRADGNSFVFPLTQADLADLMGRSTVHVNRTLQDLRATGLIAWQSGVVTVPDYEALAEMSDFSPQYLNLEKERR